MRVLKWSVPVDDEPHRIGGGPVVMVGTQDGDRRVQVWTVEDVGHDLTQAAEVDTPRQVQVYATGQYVPEPDGRREQVPIGSCLMEGFYAWHVFVVDDDRWHLQEVGVADG